MLKSIIKYLYFSVFQLFSARELTDHINKTKDILSDPNNAWEKRAEAVSVILYTPLHLYPLMLKELLQQLPSASMALFTITSELRMISQNIWRRVVENVLMNIFPLNIFLLVRLPASFYQNCQAAFGRCEH